MSTIKRISILPYTYGVGGPASFRQRFSTGLAKHGISVADDLEDPGIDAVLLISGWRELGKLRALKKRGVPIVQRLDGTNWIHRRTSLNPRYWLKAEYGNLLMNYTRLHLADHIVYQSGFVRRRWEEVYRPANIPHSIIHNSVDLTEFTPDGIAHPKTGGRQRIMVVEGSFTGGHDIGLRLVLDLADGLQVRHGIPVEVCVAGRVPEDLQEKWSTYAQVPIEWLGIIPREQIPLWDRSAALLFSAELNPACPNAVIEALACGLPVLGYDTGSLSELVTTGAGKVVPFNGNPWKLELPGTDQLVDAAAEIIRNQPAYRAGARQRAEAAFSLDQMVAQYVEVFQSV